MECSHGVESWSGVLEWILEWNGVGFWNGMESEFEFLSRS